MRIRTKHIIWISYVLLIALNSSLLGQSNDGVNRLTNSEIKDLKEVVKYSESKSVFRPKKRKRETEDDDNAIEKVPKGPSGTENTLAKIILYVLIISLVVFIVVLVFSNIQIEPDKIEPNEISLEEIEDIEEIDAEKGLTQALDSRNYREAVRMLFIQLLQYLIEENSITWKPKKTNRDYIREMLDHSKFQSFTRLVMAYEGAWYGDQEVEKDYFEHLQKEFDSFYTRPKSTQV